MKKSVLFGFLFLLVLTIGFVNATIIISLGSSKAGEISGYACDDTNLENQIEVTIIFHKSESIQFYQLVRANLPSGEATPCGSLGHNFSFNLYSNTTLLNEVFDNFPIDYIDVCLGQSCSSPKDLDFSCSNTNQTIMNLYGPKNAHVYMWNSSLPDLYPICYDNLFGYEFEGDYHPSSCNAPNTPVIWKSQLNNAHVSTKTLSGDYPREVCYGDLQCVYKNTNCLADEKTIARMYYYNNSHVSYFNDNNYTIRICCKSNFKPNPIKQADWKNLDDNLINTANLRDFVKLSLVGIDLKDKLINYTIYNSKGENVFFAQETAESDNPSIMWKAEPSDNYTFNAMIADNSLLNKNSGLLNVSNSIGIEDFGIELIKPKCAENFTVGNPVEFVIRVNTTNQLVNLNLDFGDGSFINFSNTGNNIISLNHTYSLDGTKNIILNATNYGKTVFKRKMINIILINESKSGAYVAACIDSPKDMGYIDSQKVLCNASSTRALNYISIGKIYQVINISTLHFNWTFSDNSFHHFVGVFNADCGGYDTRHDYINPSGIFYNHTIDCQSETKGYSFTKYFIYAGQNKASLVVSL